MNALFQDIHYSVRMLLKKPGFTLVAVLTLALGIGANTAIFSVVNAVLLRPLPFAKQDRLFVAWKSDQTASNPFVELSIPEFNDWKSQSQSFEHLAAMPTTVYGYGYVLTGRGEPVQIESARISSGFFQMLGVRPALGRAFHADEERPGAPRVAIISHHLWQSRFDSDRSLVGQPITLNDTSFTVVGVMSADFQFPKGVDVWSPLEATVGGGALEDRGAVFLQVVGRLKPGIHVEQAEAELNAIISRVAAQYPETDAAGHRVVMTPLAAHIFGDARPALWLLLAATALLLLIACANVANLLLARATARRKEIAVRAALGANRARLVRQLLTESLLLAAIAGALGVLLAHWLIDFLILLAPADIPRIADIHVSALVLLFTSALTLLTVALSGLAPALTASRVNLSEALGEGSVKVAGERQGKSLRGALVICEVAVTLVLLVGAGLIFRSLLNLQRVDTGLDADNVLTFQLRLFGKQYDNAQRVSDFYRQLIERLEAQPGVVAAGAILIRPLEGTVGWDVPYAAEGQSSDEAKRNVVPNFEVITPHYFDSVGIPIKAGRAFTEQDNEGAPKVVMISETMARHLVRPGVDPIGQRITLEDPTEPDAEWRTVIGVVGDARYRELKDIRWDVYVPYRQFNFPVRYITIRTASDPASFAATARREVAALDPNQAVTGMATLKQLVSTNLARPRFSATLLGLLSILAVVLAVVGLYGIVSYAVTERTHEIGVRMALGAQRSDVVRLVVRQGMVMVFIGIAAGLAISFGLTHLINNLLFGVSAGDPLTFIIVPVVLTAVALVACLVPAQRATKIDPLEALRYE